MIKFIVICVVAILISVFCTGIYECREKSKKDQKSDNSFINIVKIGLCKTLSSIGIAVVTTIVTVLLLSMFIKPEPQNVMPAIFYDGTYAELNGMEKGEDTIEMILEESEKRLSSDYETANYDIAYAYFSSNNFDLAVDAFEECYKTNPKWEYAYDLGVSYGYMMNYQKSLKYLNEALELNPPMYDRSVILDTIVMLKNYFGIWISSLV